MPPEPKQPPGQSGLKPRQDALGNKLPDPAEELNLIEKEIQDLKVAFEQYFLGVDRQSPVRRKDLLGERIRRLKNSGVVRNTSLKFRLEQVSSRYSSHDRMWTRTIQEIEAGTYRRDIFKMKLRQKASSEPRPERPKTPAPSEPALTDGQVRALFDTYVMARQRTNEPTEGITLDGLASTLRRQVPELLKKYECKAIDFKVVIKGGRTLLKAVPRK